MHARDAGFWKREVAWLIDALLLGAVLNILLSVPLALMGMLGSAPLLALLGEAWAVLAGGQAVDPGAAEALFWRLLALAGWATLLATATYALAGWAYFALMEASTWQATLGKRALGINVVDRAGARITVARASARFFAAALSWLTLNLGHAMAGWTKEKRALHDYVAGTRVENVDPSKGDLPDWARIVVWLQAALALGSVLVLAVLLAALLVGTGFGV